MLSFIDLSQAIKVHQNHSAEYKLAYQLSANYIKSNLSTKDKISNINLNEFGNINFPYYEFGDNVNTFDLFKLDELIIFSFYLKNKSKYNNVIDIGANIGLHSILMAKLGWNVKAYEPDPIHLRFLKSNISKNNLEDKINVQELAVLDKFDSLKFTRIINNTTGSHISGMKDNPYGPMDYFKVKTVPITEIIEGVDFIKLDAEGSESIILRSLSLDQLKKIDIILEVSSEKNAKEIFNYFSHIKKIKLFSQITGWSEVTDLEDMPINHKDGSLFISSNGEPPF